MGRDVSCQAEFGLVPDGSFVCKLDAGHALPDHMDWGDGWVVRWATDDNAREGSIAEDRRDFEQRLP